jgi:Electron transfer DM13
VRQLYICMFRAISRPCRRHSRLRPILVVAGVAIFIVALAVFEPWKLVINHRVNEPPPETSNSANLANGQLTALVVARGRLVSHEHASSGPVVVIRLADNSRVLRLEDLRTSDGPSLRVWLAAAPVTEGRDGWLVFDDDPHVDLGPLKGNIGSSNYPIPPEVDLAALQSVTIWCERFRVSFPQLPSSLNDKAAGFRSTSRRDLRRQHQREYRLACRFPARPRGWRPGSGPRSGCSRSSSFISLLQGELDHRSRIAHGRLAERTSVALVTQDVSSAVLGFPLARSLGPVRAASVMFLPAAGAVWP